VQRGKFVIPFSQLRMSDIDAVGGKNASLGELLSQLASAGIRVPDGFATTADAFRNFIDSAGLRQRIDQALRALDVDDVRALAAVGSEIRSWVVAAPFSTEFEAEVRSFYQWLTDNSSSEISVAVRSSATAEDLPDASFAGQQETYLNVRGVDAVLDRMRHTVLVYDRDHGFTSEFGSYGGAPGQLYHPLAIAAAPGRILVAQGYEGRVQAFGIFGTEAGE